MIHPAPNGLVGDHDAAFRQQVFDVTEAIACWMISGGKR